MSSNFNFDFTLDISIREKMMLVVLGLVAVIFIGFQVLIMPASNALSTDAATLVTTQTNVAQAKADVAQANGSSSYMEKTFAAAKNSASPLLPSADKPTLHVWLFGIIKKSGLTLQSANLSDPAAATPATETITSDGTTTTSGDITYNMKTYADAYLGKTSSTTSTTSSLASSTSSTTSDTSSASSATSSSASSNTTGDALMVSVTLQMTGSYANAKSFLDAVKKTNKYVVISSFSCTKSNKVYSCNITLECYAAEKLDGSDHIFDWTLANPAGKSGLM